MQSMRLQLAQNARLVVLLRDPSDRFYSAYNMAMNEAKRHAAGKVTCGRPHPAEHTSEARSLLNPNRA